MKTVIIYGQNHKGSSYHIGRMLAEKVAKKDEIVEFFLPKDLNHFCNGCYRCLEAEDKCPFYYEKNVIDKAIEQAELLIFTTPTYCMRASAPMKAFIDLSFIHWMPHRPKAYMFHKKAVVISTAAGAGTKKAMKDITTSLFYWGVPYIKTFGTVVLATTWEKVADDKKEKIERRIGNLAKKINATQKPKVGIKTRVIFHVMRANVQTEKIKSSPMVNDYLYWQRNGWLGKKRPWKESKT